MHILTLREKTILQTRCRIHLSSNRLEKLKKTKRKNLNTQRKPLYIKVLTWRAARDTPASQAASSATVASQQYPPQTSRLKTVRRTVFLTPLTPSGFESLTSTQKNKRTGNTRGVSCSFGVLQGIHLLRRLRPRRPLLRNSTRLRLHG